MPPIARIRLASPPSDERIHARVRQVIDSGQLVAGPAVAQFEERLRAISGRQYAVAVSSGTAALMAAMSAMGVGPGSVVLVPALTFPAPAMAAAFLGAAVRLCDVDGETFNISLETLDAALRDDVSLVVAIDQFGAPAPCPAIESRCAAAGIPVLVDAACSIGSSLMGRPCGSFGQAAIYSFHPRKIITTGEGGAVLTDDPELARAVRHLRNFGLEDGRFAGVGINLRPSEIGAAMGLVQLDDLDRILAQRRMLADIYRQLPLLFQRPVEGARVNHQTMAAVIPEVAEERRNGLMAFLRENGVESQVASFCLSRLDGLKDKFGFSDDQVPEAVQIHQTGISLPLHGALSQDDVQEVSQLVLRFLEDNGGRA